MIIDPTSGTYLKDVNVKSSTNTSLTSQSGATYVDNESQRNNSKLAHLRKESPCPSKNKTCSPHGLEIPEECSYTHRELYTEQPSCGLYISCASSERSFSKYFGKAHTT